MWKRQTLKKKARSSLKQNYCRMISVCFLIAVLTTSYTLSTTFFNLQTLPGPQYTDAPFTLGIPDSESIVHMITRLLSGTPVYEIYKDVFSDISIILLDLFSTNISVFFTSLRVITLIISTNLGATAFFPAFGILLSLVYQIFINNLILIGEKRYFLEARNYGRTAISKIFFLFKLRCISSPAWIMFCRSVFQLFWNFTVIGGIVKHYEYSLIPFILAENPKVSRKDAFFLSKQLMHNNKRKFFCLDLSFIGWKILSFSTLGLLDFLFVNPYITGTYAELYMTLRRNYVLSRSPRYDVLNDSYLEHVPSEDELLINKALYDDSQGPYTKISYFESEQYPVFLFSVQPPFKSVRSPFKTDRKYDIFSYIFLFHIFSLFGWLAETAIHLMRDGAFLKNPLLFGPWIPIYGIYGVLILLIVKKLFQNPVLVFLTNLLLYSVLEYIFNLLIDLLFHIHYRDYSRYFLNLNGRIYLGGCISFSLLGCAFLYYLAPRWTERYMKLGRTNRITLSIVLSIIFIADLLYTIATHY